MTGMEWNCLLDYNYIQERIGPVISCGRLWEDSRAFCEVELTVSCDESGHTKFPFLYPANVTWLTPAQARLRLGSVPAQGLLRFAHLC